MTFYATNYQSKMAATLRAEAMAETKTAHDNSKTAYLQRKAARNNGGHGALANRRQHARAQQNGVKFAEANGEWVDIDDIGSHAEYLAITDTSLRRSLIAIKSLN
jgi:hypothetical protein